MPSCPLGWPCFGFCHWLGMNFFLKKIGIPDSHISVELFLWQCVSALIVSAEWFICSKCFLAASPFRMKSQRLLFFSPSGTVTCVILTVNYCESSTDIAIPRQTNHIAIYTAVLCIMISMINILGVRYFGECVFAVSIILKQAIGI